MEVIYLLLPLALLLAASFVAAFVWAVRKDQYEDLDTPPLRILLDDDLIGDMTKVINQDEGHGYTFTDESNANKSSTRNRSL